MSSALTLARPYARAAFELARAAGTLRDWSERLDFAATLVNDPRVARLISDPRVPEADLVALMLPPGEAADSEFSRFVQVLVDNDRLAVIPEVAALYSVLRQDAEHTLHVRLRSANAVDASEVDKLKAALKRRFGREIEIEQEVDPTMLGGAIIDAGDVVIDGSVRGRLARLEQALVN